VYKRKGQVWKIEMNIIKGIHESCSRNGMALTDKNNVEELTRRTRVDVVPKRIHDDITYVSKSSLSLLEKVYKPGDIWVNALYSVLSRSTIKSPGGKLEPWIKVLEDVILVGAYLGTTTLSTFALSYADLEEFPLPTMELT